jgi:type VI secretion system secreted protein VgrG
MEETAASALTISGRGDGCHLAAGRRFTLRNHFDADGSYLLTRVETTASLSGAYVTSGDGELLYENRFGAIPAGLPFRPARRTPKTRIDGVQTAVVVGPAGQEIWVDPYGRVKVRFRWDSTRDSPGDDSCWIRVAQVWAGKGWGAFFWPRVGDEVVVVFEQGDPDRPLVVGCVYNGANMPPYPLPEAAMLGGFRTRIFTDATGARFNAIIFHDIPDVEYVQIHSQRNDYHHSENVGVHYVGQTSYSFRGKLK